MFSHCSSRFSNSKAAITNTYEHLLNNGHCQHLIQSKFICSFLTCRLRRKAKEKEARKMGGSSSVPEKSIHEFTVKDSKGNDVNLSNYKGKVLLVVNVASKCGYTNQNYKELTELYSKYKDKGLEILAFPCNQFLYQEPGTSQEAEQFACARFKAEYPIFQKVKVNGSGAAPVYKFLKSSKGGFCGSSIKWNFTKFLVDKDGHVIKRYGTSTPPLAIEGDIKKALGEA